MGVREGGEALKRNRPAPPSQAVDIFIVVFGQVCTDARSRIGCQVVASLVIIASGLRRQLSSRVAVSVGVGVRVDITAGVAVSVGVGTGVGVGAGVRVGTSAGVGVDSTAGVG